MSSLAATATVAISNLFWIIPCFLLAAGLGAAIRFFASGYLNDHVPTGTLVVNMVASFLLGLATSLGDSMSLIVGVGLLGAMSTWSSVANEVAKLARSNEGWLAIAYVALSCSSGILLAWFGLKLGTAI